MLLLQNYVCTFVKNTAMTKNFTFRFNPEEIKEWDDYANAIGVTRSTLIRRSVREKIANAKGLKGNDKETVIKAAGIAASSIKGFEEAASSELVKRIESEGIVVKDDRGNVIAEINSLVDLVHFCNDRVFNWT